MGVEEALRAEVDRLEAELEDVPVYRKLRAVKNLLTLYAATGASSGQARTSTKVGASTGVILDAAEEVLRRNGQRATASEVVIRLHADGVLGATDTQTIRTVASYLSNAKERFNNIRGQGYGLTSWSVSSGDEVETPIPERRSEDLIPDPPETPNSEDMLQ